MTPRVAKQARESGKEQVRIAAARHGDELVMTTTFPRHGLFACLRGSAAFDLEYRIKETSSSGRRERRRRRSLSQRR